MTDFERNLLESLDKINSELSRLSEHVVRGNVGLIGQAAVPSKMLFEWIAEWLDNEHKQNVKERVFKNDCGIIKNHVFSKPEFNKSLSDFKQLDLRELVNSIPYPRQRVIAANMLTAALRSAFQNEFMSKDITLNFKKPTHYSEEDRALSFAEEKRLIKHLRGHVLETYIKTVLYAGLRRNEALGLQRKHLDFEKDEIHIVQQVGADNIFTNQLKTKTSNRVVKMFPELKAALLPFKDCLPDVRLFDFSPDYVTKYFTDFCKRYNIVDFSIKSCRTTFATRCKEKGIPDIIIQKWLGHSTFKTTKNHYIKVNEEFVEDEFKKAIGQ